MISLLPLLVSLTLLSQEALGVQYTSFETIPESQQDAVVVIAYDPDESTGLEISDFKIEDGFTTIDEDYGLIGDGIIYTDAKGTAFVVLSFKINDDTLDEGDEDFTIMFRCGNKSYAHRVLIKDNDRP